jgi:hypothetical protein
MDDDTVYVTFRSSPEGLALDAREEAALAAFAATPEGQAAKRGAVKAGIRVYQIAWEGFPKSPEGIAAERAYDSAREQYDETNREDVDFVDSPAGVEAGHIQERMMDQYVLDAQHEAAGVHFYAAFTRSAQFREIGEADEAGTSG